MKLAVYPGTFDPITNGHADIVRRSLSFFDRVVVALAENVRKTPLFTIEERRAMIVEAVGRDVPVEVDAFSGLLVDYCKRRGAAAVIRGLRALADFEYEFQFAHMNRRLAPRAWQYSTRRPSKASHTTRGSRPIASTFLMTSEESFYVSSSLVKEVALMGGDVSRMVPPAVVAALNAKRKQGVAP